MSAHAQSRGVRSWFTPWRAGGLLAGVAAFAALAAWDGPLKDGADARAALTAAVAALMALWWITEALPIHVTACVPLVLFPLARPFEGSALANLRAAAQPYIDPYVFLFMGGMALAAALQRWNLHRRIALAIMARIGTDPRRLLAGVLVATAFISLWISNTATAVMMLPIALALIAQLERNLGGRRLEHFGAALVLAVAYASNVGGIGTKIGTAPNAQLAGFLAQQGVPVSFLEFMAIGTGFVALFLPVIWLALWRLARGDAFAGEAARAALGAERRALGAMQRGEWVVLCVFLAAVAAWIASAPIHAAFARPGLRTAHVEGGIALCAAVALLVWRVGGRAVLDFASLRAVPWSTLILLGGGFSLAAAVQASGLSDALARSLVVLRELPRFQAVLLATGATVAISAICSNSATIGVMLPLLWGAVARVDASTVVFAAAIGASCDFALPAGTPPNAIVFGSGYITIPRMLRIGAPLDLAATVVAAAWCALMVRVIL